MTQLHRITKISSALLALSLALANASAADYPALASVEASVKKSEMFLIDLTPRDGKAPSFSFPAFSQSSSAFANFDMAGTASDLHSNKSNSQGSDIRAAIYRESVDAYARSYDWGDTFARMYVTGIGLGESNVNTGVKQLIGVSVGAHTRLIYNGTAEIRMNEWYQTPTNRTFNSGSVSVGLNGVFEKIDFKSEDFTGGYAVRTEEFSIAYDNNTDAAQTVWMSVDTAIAMHYATNATPTVPVPEPETYAMLGLGALVVGACARRRRRMISAA
jgi:hypothetical protein